MLIFTFITFLTSVIKFLLYCYYLGVLGIKVKIMLPHDPSNKVGPQNPLPDHIEIKEPVDLVNPTHPFSEHREQPVLQPPPAQVLPPQQAY